MGCRLEVFAYHQFKAESEKKDDDDGVDSRTEKAINNAITTLDDFFLCRAFEGDIASNLITAQDTRGRKTKMNRLKAKQ